MLRMRIHLFLFCSPSCTRFCSFQVFDFLCRSSSADYKSKQNRKLHTRLFFFQQHLTYLEFSSSSHNLLVHHHHPSIALYICMCPTSLFIVQRFTHSLVMRFQSSFWRRSDVPWDSCDVWTEFLKAVFFRCCFTFWRHFFFEILIDDQFYWLLFSIVDISSFFVPTNDIALALQWKKFAIIFQISLISIKKLIDSF